MVSAPLTNIRHLPHVIFWTWFHLLQFVTSNQTLDPEEDEHNKRYRPLPGKRVTLRNAVILRWALVPACWALSACYSNGHWVVRSFMNAVGFVALEVGATLLAGEWCSTVASG